MRILALVVAACAMLASAHDSKQRRTEYLTPELVSTHGTRTFPVPKSVAMEATAAALRASGYGVAIENPDRGIVKTDRKLISTTSRTVSSTNSWSGNRSSSAQAVAETMQFVARFSAAPGGGTTVRLEPTRYRGDADITSTEPFWEGYLQEQWDRIFRDLEDALPAPTAPERGDTI